MPPMEPIKPKQTSVDVKAAKPVSSVAAKTIVNTEIVDIDADTQVKNQKLKSFFVFNFFAVDSNRHVSFHVMFLFLCLMKNRYGSTKKKLELANKIIAELKKQK